MKRVIIAALLAGLPIMWMAGCEQSANRTTTTTTMAGMGRDTGGGMDEMTTTTMAGRNGTTSTTMAGRNGTTSTTMAGGAGGATTTSTTVRAGGI